MGKEAFLFLASYAFGCISTGYYLVRLYTGNDIRNTGSGSSGATNAGRLLGIWGFSITLLLDAGKGALVAYAAFYFGFGSPGSLLAILATVVGHIWPFQLKFRGGRGIAPALGGLLVFDFRFGVLMIALAAFLFALVRRFVLSGLLAVIVSPAAAFFLGHSPTVALEMLVLVFLILISHRKHIPPMMTRSGEQETG